LVIEGDKIVVDIVETEDELIEVDDDEDDDDDDDDSEGLL
jgi:hypothetical protein